MVTNWKKPVYLKYEDKNGDGRIQYVGKNFKGVDANGDLIVNEMTKVDRDIMVLANPEIAQLPNWVIALVAAGGIAAALSTAAGLLLAISSAISHDIVKGIIAKDIDDKTELMAGRIAMAGAICVAGYLGLHPPGFAAQVVALAFGLAASSIFPALMMGILQNVSIMLVLFWVCLQVLELLLYISSGSRAGSLFLELPWLQIMLPTGFLVFLQVPLVPLVH